MAEFKVPELGENIAQGDVTRVLVNVGDTIAKEQAILELETDKATIEVPSSIAGVVTAIKVKAGDKVQVGSVILTVDDAASGNDAAAASAQPEAKPEAAAAGKSEARAAAPAQAAEEGEPADTGSDAAVADAQEPPATPQEQKVVAMPRAAEKKAAEPAKAAPAKAEAAKGVAAPASPSVRRLAREIGVDINVVHGSGDSGRISEDDVKEHARRILSSVGASRGSGASAAAAVPLPDFSKWGAIDRQPMSNIRRKTAEHLSHAWTSIPHVTQFDKADITPMEELRKKFRGQVEKAGGNLTVTAVLVKVLAAAVKQFPQFNASIDQASGELIFKKYFHIGVAVDTEWGLLVPVIRNVDQKNITQIAVELHTLSEKARSKKLTLDEMSGGSMSISNLGGIGGTAFTPIVNWPEVAILGVSRGIIEPVWRNNAFEPRQLLPLSLSYDHRVIDGADAMRFLRWVVAAIEQPFLLSLLG
ncbi:MAG: 2-oxo acid dehydrogenase subunit E2 [Acidobacteriota bacterium]